MKLKYFRSVRNGPEADLEKIVIKSLPDLFVDESPFVWIGGSVPVGAGLPDLVTVRYRPEVFSLAVVHSQCVPILAYLKTANRAQPSTIANRLNVSPKVVEGLLQELVSIGAIENFENSFSILPLWREILPEVISIETKVDKWKGAVQQASRNRIFSHRSFVATPARVADRVKSEVDLTSLGLGLLAIDESSRQVSMLRKSRFTMPRAWVYYYKLAATLARNFNVSRSIKLKNGVRGSDRRGGV